MIAFTFPGQGSQKPAMGEAWIDHPSWSVVAEVSEASGRDVAALLCRTDAATLTETRRAQLATFAASLVVLDAVRSRGVTAAVTAGHSLGEYTALVAAGCLSVADGARLVAARGDAMQEAADRQPGTMAAVLGLDAAAVEAACAEVGADVWLANDNAPGQVVIAGSPMGIDAAGTAAKARGAKRVMALPVGGAFHTPFMAPAADALATALAAVAWAPGFCDVVANVDATAHGAGTSWSDLLTAQLTSPVRWRESLDTLAQQRTSLLIELGPGSVLTGLAKRTVTDIAAMAVSGPDDLDDLVDTVAAIR
jgi:[acyl-carrier-protein] S-malonyltransferase